MKEVANTEDHEFMQDKYYRICNELLRLEVTKGHLNWSVSEVARASEVTRSLIYYYFGKSKEEVLSEASRYMINTIYGDSEFSHIGVKNRVKKVIAITNDNPYLFIYWYNNRGKDNQAGNLIDQKELRGRRTIKSYYPEMSDKEVSMVQALQISAVAMRWDEKTVDEMFKGY